MMPTGESWAVGVDLGGTKMLVAQVDAKGKIHRTLRRPTDASEGPSSVKAKAVAAIKELIKSVGSRPVGIGVGVAGQVDAKSGVVRGAPNLGWRDEPFRGDLKKALGMPIVITNDVRAATWGEWLYGAGQGCGDIVCLFVGTGIGGGVVSGGKVLSGCSNAAGELGHITIDLNGPPCRCGNRGCLEALAGGWAIAQQARSLVTSDPAGGAFLLKMAGGRPEEITAKIVTQAAKGGDLLAQKLIERVVQALIAGAVSLVNAFNPCRLILSGGVIEGFPALIKRVAAGVEEQALEAARRPLRIMGARLGNHAGVVGAAALAMRPAKK